MNTLKAGEFRFEFITVPRCRTCASRFRADRSCYCQGTGRHHECDACGADLIDGDKCWRVTLPVPQYFSESEQEWMTETELVVCNGKCRWTLMDSAVDDMLAATRGDWRAA
jgi:hypothetical protein